MQNLNSAISSNDLEIIKTQNEGGFPLKKTVAIFFIIAWNLLFLSDIIPFFLKGDTRFANWNWNEFSNRTNIISSTLAIVSEKFQKIILKENRNFEDIKKFAYFIALVSGIMFLAFTIENLNKQKAERIINSRYIDLGT